MLLDIPHVLLYLAPKKQQNPRLEESRLRRGFGHLRPEKASLKFLNFDPK